jgi:hypothetical protein
MLSCVVTDRTIPSLTCVSRSAYVIESATATRSLDMAEFVGSVEPGAVVTANPPVILLTAASIDQVAMVTLTARDVAANENTCRVQVLATGK